jgi:hypothetical protein
MKRYSVQPVYAEQNSLSPCYTAIVWNFPNTIVQWKRTAVIQMIKNMNMYIICASI